MTGTHGVYRHQSLCACQRGLLCKRQQEILRTVCAPPNLLTEIASWTLHKTSSGQKKSLGAEHHKCSRCPHFVQRGSHGHHDGPPQPASSEYPKTDSNSAKNSLKRHWLLLPQASSSVPQEHVASLRCATPPSRAPRPRPVLRHTIVDGTASTAGAGATDTADTSTMYSATGAGTACTPDWRSDGAGVAQELAQRSG